jgi:hypothetical protein
MTRTRNPIAAATALLLLLCASGWTADSPSFDIDWYGYVKLDASYDQNLTSHGNFAMWVKPQNADGENDEQFNMTHKQTRFGAALKGVGYSDVDLGGKVEFDLYGSGGTENKALLLLRHAFFSVDHGAFQLIGGQTWDLVAPLNPATLNYPVLWGCGNPGYRRPQIRFTYNGKFGPNTDIRVASGLFRTIGSDLTPTFTLSTEVSDGSDDGTDAGIPTVQGVLDITHKSSSGTTLRAGVSGLWGQLKAEGNMGSNETYTSQGVFGHFMASFGSFGFAGEAFSGVNIGGYNAGINNSNTIDGVNAVGGWGYFWFKPHQQWQFAAGGGMDDPDDSDLATGARSKNQAFFGNVKYSPVPRFTVGFELSQWETTYKDAEASDNLRAQTSFMINF